jgi:hypothetical protein
MPAYKRPGKKDRYMVKNGVKKLIVKQKIDCSGKKRCLKKR